MSIVIAGGGLAALRALEALRGRGWTGRASVVSEEHISPYNRPPLSKEMLWGETTEDDVIFQPSDEANQNTEWILGTRVVSTDLERRTITVENGREISFEGLVAATGVHSRRLEFPGPRDGRTALRTLADTRRIAAELKPGRRFVILGAGFIGCEVAATARRAGCEVDVVSIGPCAMNSSLGVEVGSEIQRRHEREGIRFHTGRTVLMAEGDDRVEAIVLDDGTRLPADILLETIGSAPSTDWLVGNNLDLSDGVLVDEHLRIGGTQGMIAVGDVARFTNQMYPWDPPMRVEHWQTAIDTAAIAARTLLYDLGESEETPPAVSLMPWFWSDQGEIRLTSYGMLRLADRTELIEGDLANDCAISYLRGDEPVGVVLIGMKEKGARYKRWLAKERKRATASVTVE